jgi:hypothetical protein
MYMYMHVYDPEPELEPEPSSNFPIPQPWLPVRLIHSKNRSQAKKHNVNDAR